MSDFERLFGAGAELDSMLDGFSRSAKIEAEQSAKEWLQFSESVLVDARIDAEGYSLFFADYDAAIEFESASKTYGKFDYSFVRVREGSGFRVTIDPNSHKSYFSRKGRIVVTKSEEDAQKFRTQTPLPTFSTERRFGEYEPILNSEYSIQFFRERVARVFRSLTEESTAQEISIIDFITDGKDVLVFGSDLRPVLELRARFIGWHANTGYTPITTLKILKSFECQTNSRRNSVAF